MRSILDTDLYKLTQQQFVLQKYPRALAKYRFKNRNPNQPITAEMIFDIREDIRAMAHSQLTDAEEVWLRAECPYLFSWYIDWLKTFRFKLEQIQITPCEQDNGGPATYEYEVTGPWCETILWEVPLLAIISKHIMAAQINISLNDELAIMELTRAKGKKLREAGCKFVDFGTRRRFSYENHSRVLEALIDSAGENLLGTSNVHLAMAWKIKPIGTMAHELIQAMAGLAGLRYANKYAMDAWNDVYKGSLGIMLPDTYGTDGFLKDFDGVYARLFDGVRQDSGDPVEFLHKIVAHYKKLGIDPKSKTIVFSDSLNVEKAIKLQKVASPLMKVAFGIGTHLTNDIPNTTPANIVIKLVEINGIPVVKLSDTPGKAIGDPRAIEVAKWTFGIK